MKRIRRPSTQIVLVLALLLAVAASRGTPQLAAEIPAAEIPAAPRLDPDPEARRFAAALEAAGNGGMDWELLLRAALWSSGAAAGGAPASGAGSAGYSEEAGFRSAVAQLLAPGYLPAEGRERAEKVLTFMHRTFLRSYSERQTRLDTLLRRGTYNCVSSAVLYLILGRAAGLDVGGVVTRDHAFCTVSFGGELIDVETTSPYGFDPGSKTEFHDEFGRVTGFSYVSPRNYRERSPLGPVELVSLIFSNRIADADAAGRYAESVGYALDRRDLLHYRGSSGDATLFGSAERDLLDRLLNYGAALARAGRETEALDWARAATDRYGTDPRWQEFCYSALNNRIVKLLRTGNGAAGREEFQRYADLTTAAQAGELDRLITDAELVALVRSVRDDSAAARAEAAITAAQGRQAVDAARAVELRVFISLAAAERAAETQGFAAAIQVLDRAVDALGRRRPLLDARQAFKANRVAELHNRFAVLFNEGRHAEARDAAVAALAEFPGEARLRADLDFVEKILQEKR